MELSIINRVAQIVTSNKIEQALGKKEPVAAAPRRSPPDFVNVSGEPSDAKTVAARLAALPEKDAERAERLEQLKAQVREKKYALSPEMVDSIAEKIAKTMI